MLNMKKRIQINLLCTSRFAFCGLKRDNVLGLFLSLTLYGPLGGGLCHLPNNPAQNVGYSTINVSEMPTVLEGLHISLDAIK